MGGKKGNKSKKSKTKTAVQKAAEARHAKFKQTKVQTFGGKRTSFSNAEKTRIKKAGYSVDGYSKAAPNKASGYSGTSGVSVGSKIKNPNPKTTGVGPVVSGREYSDMLKANPPRFNEAGRNEVNQNVASAFSAGSGLFGDDIDVGDGVFRTKDQIKKMYLNPGNFNLQPGDRLYKQIQEAGKGLVSRPTDTKLAMDNLGGYAAAIGGLGSMTIMGANAIKNMYQNTVPKLKEKLEKRYDTGEDVSSTGIGDASNLVASTNLSGLGMTPKTTTGYDPGSTAFALRTGDFDPASYEKFKAANLTAGGLNIGGSESTSESGSRSRVLTSEQLADRYKSTLNPDSFKGLSDGETFGSGPVASGEDYARGLNVSPYGSVENTMRSIVGKIPLVNRIPGVNTRLLTDKEIADKRVSAQNQLAYRKEMAKFRGAGGGTRLPVTPTVIEEIIPEALPVPSASTTPTTQTGVDPNRLLQIQQQAYAQAYNPMLIGGFNPQFRFGAATPTIDYSTYFNY